MLKVVISIAVILTLYLVSLMWSDKNDAVFNKSNLVIFTVDTLRADHLSIYGYKYDTSPNLAAIADDSIIFDNVYTVSTYSAPSHAAILTGAHPLQFSNNNNYLKIPNEVETLAEILQRNGYKTAAFIGDSVLGRDGNFHRGFESFALDEISADIADLSVTQSWAERGWVKAKHWLESWIESTQTIATHEKQPFFLWFHANHPHGSYAPPPPYKDRFSKQVPAEIEQLQLQLQPEFSLDSFFRKQIEKGQISDELIAWVEAKYDGEIAYVDYLFGQLINVLKNNGEYDNTVIIFVADHGEVLFEHWRPGKIRSVGHHANLYYKEVLNIPLVIKPNAASALLKGKRSDSLISSIDIFNTALDLLELPQVMLSHSKSIKPALLNNNIEHRKSVLFGAEAYDNRCAGINNKKWQLVRCEQDQQKKHVLFNLIDEPRQQTNLAEKQWEMVKLLEKELDGWLNKLQQPYSQEQLERSGQLREHLEKAGYLDKRTHL